MSTLLSWCLALTGKTVISKQRQDCSSAQGSKDRLYVLTFPCHALTNKRSQYVKK